MIDRLQPDYSNVSPLFENAVLDQTSVANILPNIHGTYHKTPVQELLNSLDHQLASELATAAIASNQALVDNKNHECVFSVSSTGSSLTLGRVAVAPSKVVNLKTKLILAYPFDYNEAALLQAADGLIKLGGVLLGLDDTKYNRLSMPQRKMNNISIRNEDMDRLKYGKWLNNSLIDFGNQWMSRNEGFDSMILLFTTQFMENLTQHRP